MLELAIKGSKKYYIWVAFLLVVIGIGFLVYLKQLSFGLGITGLSRDVSWGFYIANFTFLVGVAAGGVMVVLPYYLHDYKAFGRITILGEFLAIAALVMCITFVVVDLGQPMRVFNTLLYPSPGSILFWDIVVLQGYLFLNIIIGWNVLEAERNGTHYQAWVTPLIYLVDSLGRQHSYGNGFPLRGASRERVLDDCHYGAAIFVIGVCCRTGLVDSSQPVHSSCNQV